MSVYNIKIICPQCKKENSEPVESSRVLICTDCKNELLTIKEFSAYIYVLSNESHFGLLKIGFTEKPLLKRVKELSASNYMHVPYILEASFFSENQILDEAELYNLLERYKSKRGKELFKLTVKEAVEIITANLNATPCIPSAETSKD